jgi:biotin carboxyl carrier protein
VAIDGSFEGEFPAIADRVLVSPTWGRLHHHRVREGRQLRSDTVIGEVRTHAGRVQLRSQTRGTFVTWLADEGEAVRKGRPVALMRAPSDDPGGLLQGT